MTAAPECLPHPPRAPRSRVAVLALAACALVLPLLAAAAAAQDWGNLGGNAARNAESAGGPPHLSARWSVPLDDYALEALILTRRAAYRRQEAVMFPANQPLAVGDVIVRALAVMSAVVEPSLRL